MVLVFLQPTTFLILYKRGLRSIFSSYNQLIKHYKLHDTETKRVVGSVTLLVETNLVEKKVNIKM